MDAAQLMMKMKEFAAELIREGFLDDQFRQLLSLPTSTPVFVADMVKLYLSEYEKMLGEMMQNTSDLDKFVFLAMQLKGSSLSMGARRVAEICDAVLACCKKNDEKGGIQGLAQLKEELFIMKGKLQPFLAL